MKRSLVRAVLGAGIAISVAAACGGTTEPVLPPPSPPPSPPPPPPPAPIPRLDFTAIAGVWTGDVTDDLSGALPYSARIELVAWADSGAIVGGSTYETRGCTGNLLARRIAGDNTVKRYWVEERIGAFACTGNATVELRHDVPQDVINIHYSWPAPFNYTAQGVLRRP